MKTEKEVPDPKSEGHKPMAPTTTAQEDLTTLGQRNINLMWEKTQSIIALGVVFGGFAVNIVVIIVILMPFIEDLETNQVALISLCLQFINLTVGIIIGFYFSRTNHTAVGGTGSKMTKDGNAKER